MKISLRISLGFKAVSRSVAFRGVWKKEAASIFRDAPPGPAAVMVASSAIKAGPRLEAQIKDLLFAYLDKEIEAPQPVWEG